MRFLRGSESIEPSSARRVVTIGNFDGVHLGHRAIIDTVVSRARDLDGEAVVFTFDPHPRKVIGSGPGPGLLTTLEQKLELLELAGVDLTLVENFTPEFAKTPADVFVRDIVYARLDPVEVYVGYDFHFGHDRHGSMRMLTEAGPQLGFAVTIIPEVTMDDGDVNSTRIRELLAKADPERAARMLGRFYTVRGKVIEGDRRGRTLGFPTANLEPENEVLPQLGVYAGRLTLLDDGDPKPGQGLPTVINVGQRPTFGKQGAALAEAHVLDFEGDLYGRRVELAFCCHLRPEQRFPGPDALRQQIALDTEAARRRLESL